MIRLLVDKPSCEKHNYTNKQLGRTDDFLGSQTNRCESSVDKIWKESEGRFRAIAELISDYDAIHDTKERSR